MVMKYGEALGKAFRFFYRPKAWVPVFLLDFVFLTLLMLFVMGNFSTILTIILAAALNPEAMVQFTGYILLLGLVAVAWVLLRLWVMGAIVHLSHKEKEFRKGFDVSFRRYLSLFLSALITVALGAVFSLAYLGIYLPWITPVGIGLQLIVMAGLFFIIQGVIVSNFGPIKTTKDSWHIFAASSRAFRVKGWLFIAWLVLVVAAAVVLGASSVITATDSLTALSTWILVSIIITLLLYTRVFIAYIVSGIISFLVGLVFSLPMVALVLSFALQQGAISPVTLAASVLLLLVQNVVLLYVVMVVVLVGIALATSFMLKFQTELYLQLKKKRFGLF